MSNWRNRKLSPADEALVADVENRLGEGAAEVLGIPDRSVGQAVDEEIDAIIREHQAIHHSGQPCPEGPSGSCPVVENARHRQAVDPAKIADWQKRAVAWFQGDPEPTGERAAYLLAQHTPALLADLDAAREALRRAQDVLDAAVAYVTEPDGSDMVEQYWHELDVATRQYLAAAVDTYETQEGTG